MYTRGVGWVGPCKHLSSHESASYAADGVLACQVLRRHEAEVHAALSQRLCSEEPI